MAIDRGEREVRKLLQEKNGSEWSPGDLRNLIFAFADDQEADHDETVQFIREHEKAALVRDQRLDAMETWRDVWVQDSPRREHEVMKKHAAFHEKYVASLARRRTDPVDADFVKDRNNTLVNQRFTKEQVVTAVILFLVAIIVSNLIGAFFDGRIHLNL